MRELSETSAIASVAVDLAKYDYQITDVSQRLESLNEKDANGKYKYGDWKVNIAYTYFNTLSLVHSAVCFNRRNNDLYIFLS